MRKLFVDTNIVIDLLCKREPFYEAATRLFSMAYNKEVSLYISSNTYATASYLLRKHSAERIKLLLHDLRTLSKVAITDEKVVDCALASDFADIEDAIQYYSALRMKTTAIITRNKKDFLLSDIPVMTAEEYIQN